MFFQLPKLFRLWSWLGAAWLLVDRGWCLLSDSDSGYTYPSSYPLKDGMKFEYIVVGAGTAGSAVAARLALAGRDVLLVEAGSNPSFLTKIPGASMALLGSSQDWQYDTEPNNKSCLSYRKQQCRFSRGKCLGGSSGINYMMYTRGSPRDFDDLNITGWTWNDLKPYFLRYEGLQDLDRLPPSSAPYHNTDGTMRVGFFSDSENDWHEKLIKAYESLNIPFNPDVDAQSQIGVTQVLGYVFDNERMSTARGYLARDDVKKRLKVSKRTTCTSVILDENNVAQGITVAYGLIQRTLKLYATKEVILSAGAIETPHILMLSGIGPKEHLQEFNITVKLDLPVGSHLTDHVFPLMAAKVDYGVGLLPVLTGAITTTNQFAELLVSNNGPLTSNGLTDVTTFFNMDCYDFDKGQLKNDSEKCTVPDSQVIHAYIARGLAKLGGALFQHGIDVNDEVNKQFQEINSKYALLVLSPLLLYPDSKGTVRLASKDPLAAPAISPNFLSEDSDMEKMMNSIRIMEQLMESEAMSGAELVRLQLEGCPGVDAGAEYWSCYARHMTHTTYHAVGTAGVGRVLDARLRVLGAGRLRVADLAAMPRLVRGNTAATAIAIGEMCADFALSEQ